jgi:glycosyltransferase involved in cell wall biosynthesis
VKTPKLSIIVATYNAAATLERCLQSIISQTFENWELIVADGCSSDATVDILRKHAAHITHWHSHPDTGIYDAWNQALTKSNGEYVCFLGADDAWSDPQALQVLFEAVGTQIPDLVSAQGLMIDTNGLPLGTIGRRWDYNGLRRRMLICHPGALQRRELFDAYGSFDTRYRIAADYDWMLRLPPSTSSLFVDRVVVRIQDGGVSRQRNKTNAEYWLIQTRSARVGCLRATLTYLDRMWRPIAARVLGQHY